MAAGAWRGALRELATQTRGARKLSAAVRTAGAPLHRLLAAARPAVLAAPHRASSAPSCYSTGPRGLEAACTDAASAEKMAAVAAAANGGSAAAQRSFLLPEELRAQFNQQIDLMAVRVPKQSTNQYMKRLSK